MTMALMEDVGWEITAYLPIQLVHHLVTPLFLFNVLMEKLSVIMALMEDVGQEITACLQVQHVHLLAILLLLFNVLMEK